MKRFKTQILDKTFEVRYTARRPIHGNWECWGTIDFDKAIIRICDKQNDHRKQETLIHEFMHALHPEWSEKKVLLVGKQLNDALMAHQELEQ